MLVISITFVVFCTKNTIESIDAITSSGGITKTFIGLILLPIVANATTLVTAATVAIKDKMDLAISIVIATSLELGLFVLPLLVVVGWGLKIDDMTLLFDGFQITILFVTILLLNHLVQDGKSQWYVIIIFRSTLKGILTGPRLEGAVLIAIYLIVSVAAWFYPS
jgi:Ca2+:H+ antiporter